MNACALRLTRRARGVAAVEFALAAPIFFALMFGVIEVGRMLWVWNAAVEATRLGARMAVVCDKDDADIKAKMLGTMHSMQGLTDSNITLTYLDLQGNGNCTADTCAEVQVTFSGYQHQTLFIPITVTLPQFRTSMRKEFMNSTGNSVCG